MMASAGEDFSGFSQSQGEEQRPGREERERMIQRLEDQTKTQTVALAQAGPSLEESIGPEVRKSN